MHRVTGLAAEQAALRYLNEAREIHEDLRRILTQVSGFSLMLMTSDGPRLLPEAPIRSAVSAVDEVAEAVRALAVPPVAAHHHHHLSGACAAVTKACAAALACSAPATCDRDREALIDALKATVAHLRALSHLLPGFEPVRFDQACCAAHAMTAS